jgi:hypothetical protein
VTQTRQWHYIKPNETTSVPRKHVFLDTESAKRRTVFGQVQVWGIGVACFREQRPDRKPRERWETWDDPVLMWRSIDGYVGKSGRTVLWCHNLGYDARIADMFELLPSMGWALVAHNLIGRGCWLMWRKGRASLTMVDSGSVFPCELLRIGNAIGLNKFPLPDVLDNGIGLYSRCWRDVDILRTAVLSYLDWLEREDCGNWQLTGAGQSWATFRHRFMDKRLLVHDDSSALAAERRAMWTGRCEAYWHGELGFQVVHEWDLSLAYPRLAREINVPVRLLGPMPGDYPWRRQLASQSTAILAEVEITTEVPVVPTVHNGRIVWPVGTFTTTLWDVEIQEALTAGATVHMGRAWLYHKAPALKKWGDWIIDQLEQMGDGTGSWLYIVLKHWSRALIGRFAMTYTRWEEWATSPVPMVRAHNTYDRHTGETYRTVQIGQTLWKDVGQEEWSNSMPMVTGYIQACARVRLWQIMQECPEGSILYVDTDSVLVTDMHSSALAEVAARHPGWGLRLKRSWQGFAIWGPRQIRTGQSIRVSGVPTRAKRTDAMHFVGEVWETLEGALHRGNAGSVHIRDREWTISGVDHRREGPPIGWTRPHRLPYPERVSIEPTEEGHHGEAQPRKRTRAATSGREPGQPGPKRAASPIRPRRQAPSGRERPDGATQDGRGSQRRQGRAGSRLTA